MPRVACYFDAMVGDIDWAYNEFTGELFTIKEFNAAHHDIKLAPVQGLCFSARILNYGRSKSSSRTFSNTLIIAGQFPD